MEITMRKFTSICAAALLTLGVVACQNEETVDDREDTMSEEMDDLDEMDDMDDAEEM
jgi:hypothetical protein